MFDWFNSYLLTVAKLFPFFLPIKGTRFAAGQGFFPGSGVVSESRGNYNVSESGVNYDVSSSIGLLYLAIPMAVLLIPIALSRLFKRKEAKSGWLTVKNFALRAL